MDGRRKDKDGRAGAVIRPEQEPLSRPALAGDQGPGHYFDQVIFDMQYRLLAARARNLVIAAQYGGEAFDVARDGTVRRQRRG